MIGRFQKIAVPKVSYSPRFAENLGPRLDIRPTMMAGCQSDPWTRKPPPPTDTDLRFASLIKGSLVGAVMMTGVVMDWLRPQDSSLYVPPAPVVRTEVKAPAPRLSFEVTVDTPLRPFGPMPRDGGGVLATYFSAVLKANVLNEEVRIKGTCISACTVYLGARNACVYPDAVLWFHAAHHGETKEIDRPATRQMMGYWPPAVQDWAVKQGVPDSVSFTRRWALTGDELIAMGIIKCA